MHIHTANTRRENVRFAGWVVLDEAETGWGDYQGTAQTPVPVQHADTAWGDYQGTAQTPVPVQHADTARKTIDSYSSKVTTVPRTQPNLPHIIYNSNINIKKNKHVT